jgi:UDP-N-acetylmuramoyl-L-alanyl-D-glutamate--2,6-diaminopimelate ligase
MKGDMSVVSRMENGERPFRSGFDVASLEDLGARITNLVTDSRAIRPGDTFVAYPGENLDGRKYIPQAIAAGASSVLWDRARFAWDSNWKVPNLPVNALRSAAGVIADHVYGHPSDKLWLIGITGTNGKTSCSHWIAQAMTALGTRTAIIGTLGNGFPGELAPGANTTPDAVLLQKEMAIRLKQGARAVAMEVSSHGIAQDRINGSTFAVALLTNLSRDHFDYHGSMEAYAAAKARLFLWPGLKHAVLNLDDPFGVELSRKLEGAPMEVIGFGFDEYFARVPPRKCAENMKVMRGLNLKADSRGLSFDVEFGSRKAELRAKVIGRFNASNLLGVLATLVASGFELQQAVEALATACPVAGRMEQLGGGERPLVVIDYAHTPDALEKVLTTVREIVESAGRAKPGAFAGRIICVFGCGGNRDRGKRRLMGEVATRLADEVVITSDNPRKEDSGAIIREIRAGVSRDNYRIEEDRAKAIWSAIREARMGDVVVIAGKGHETCQEINGRKHPFSDIDEAREAISASGGH